MSRKTARGAPRRGAHAGSSSGRAAGERTPGNDKSSRTRRALLEAAKCVFARTGFAKSEIAAITRESGHATGTFYWHFNNKIELLKELAALFEQDLARGSAAPHAPEQLYEVLRHLWDTYKAHSQTVRTLAEVASSNREIAAINRKFRAVAFADFRAMAVAAHPSPGPEVDFDMMATALETIVNGCLFEWLAVGAVPKHFREESAFQMFYSVIQSAMTSRPDLAPVAAKKPRPRVPK